MKKKFKFVPPWYVRSRHIQTMVGPLFNPSQFGQQPEIWSFYSEGGALLRGKFWANKKTNKLAILYHGLGGTPDAHYMIGEGLRLFKSGFSVLRMALRGADTDVSVTPDLYHGALTKDFDSAVLQALHRGYEDIYLVTHSLSSATILNWMAQKHQPIKKAFVVAPPLDTFDSLLQLDEKRNRVYQRYFLGKLWRLLKLKAKHHPQLYGRYLRTPEKFYSMRDFDEHFTAPHFGFKDAVDYHQHTDCRKAIDYISNETVIVHAQDDPFVSVKHLLKLKKKQNKSPLQIHISSHGGHMGFYSGRGRYVLQDWVDDSFRQ